MTKKRSDKQSAEKSNGDKVKTINVGKNTLEQILGMIRSMPCCKEKIIITGNFDKMSGISHVNSKIKNLPRVKTSINSGKIIVYLQKNKV